MTAQKTLVEQVMGGISDRIARRELRPGARLPSIRRMAADLAVSKSTVVEAYDRLSAEGIIQPRPGSGFYVQGRAAPLILTEAPRRPDRSIDPLWIMRQSLEGSEGAIRPGCGWLPESWLPVETVRRAVRSAARGPDRAMAEYGPPLGYPPLRQHLEHRLMERGIPAPAPQIMLTDSGSQAIDLACRFLLEPGDRVLVDDPCYFNFRAVIAAHRAVPLGVPWTPQGPDLARFAELAAAHRPRLYLTNASVHNPTGTSLGAMAAHRLLRLAEDHDITMIEDDIFGDFAPETQPRLAMLDGLNRVIYLGSYSKTLSAALRCGFIAARPDWIEGLTDLKLATGFGSSDFTARTLHQLLTDGSYRRHLALLRGRLDAARPRLAKRLTDLGLSVWGQPEAGMFLWASLPGGLDSADLARAALAHDIVLAPGNVFSVSQSAGEFLRFNAAQEMGGAAWEVLGRLIGEGQGRCP